MSKICVIVPVYKVEKYICRCIESILGQTYKDFSLILVDDGSPDNCGRICDEYEKKDERVYVIHQINRGLSAARNVGIEKNNRHIKAEWITFIDSDDWIHPQYLENLLNAAIKDEVFISTCGIIKVKAKTTMETCSCVGKKRESHELYMEYAKKIMNVSACGKLYNQKCFENVRYPEGKLWEDLATTYKIILSVPFCSVIDEPLYYYFDNSEGIVKRKWTPKRLDEFDAYEEQLEFFSKGEKWREIYIKLQETYIKAISYSCYMMRESDLMVKEKRYYTKLLKKKVRVALRNFKKTSGKRISYFKNKTVYETAYPRIMYIYWLFYGIGNKIMRNKSIG